MPEVSTTPRFVGATNVHTTVVPTLAVVVLRTGCGVVTTTFEYVGTRRPTLWPENDVNHRLLSGPSVIPSGTVPVRGTGNSVITPAGVMWPMLSFADSVNQRLPSGPVTIVSGWLDAVGTANSVIVPDGVIRAIFAAPYSVNQRLPSGPTVMP